jgi:hypothetical protein
VTTIFLFAGVPAAPPRRLFVRPDSGAPFLGDDLLVVTRRRVEPLRGITRSAS